MLPKICAVLFLLSVIFLVIVYNFIPHTFNLWYGILYYQWIGSEYSVKNWKIPTTFCGGNFIGYGNQFAELHNAKVMPSKPGYFCIPCSYNFPSYNFYERINPNHLNKWVKNLCYMEKEADTVVEIVHETTMAVYRYEYANIYHQMTDWYNIFTQAMLMGYDPKNLNILFVDRHHRPGILDKTWDALFKSVTFISDLTHPVVYSKLVWAVISYNSPLLYHQVQKPLPYIEDFRKFFSQRYKIISDKTLNCSKLNITFLWRRDYISHIGNPSGQIKRKITNEEELIDSVKGVMRGHVVRGIQLEKLSMTEQIETITSTDILIGMHGAGLTYVLFLPPHAGVLEFFPNDWIIQYPCFKAMANWRQLHYISWTNNDPKEEFNYSTYLSPSVVQKNVKILYSNICNQ